MEPRFVHLLSQSSLEGLGVRVKITFRVRGVLVLSGLVLPCPCPVLSCLSLALPYLFVRFFLLNYCLWTLWTLLVLGRFMPFYPNPRLAVAPQHVGVFEVETRRPIRSSTPFPYMAYTIPGNANNTNPSPYPNPCTLILTVTLTQTLTLTLTLTRKRAERID
jgi:hypothetical protein